MTGETSRVIERLERNYNLTTLQKPYKNLTAKPQLEGGLQRVVRL